MCKYEYTKASEEENEVYTQLDSIAIEVENMSPPRNHLLQTYREYM